jgi:DNA-binding transcriptional MerR regulator/methanogenic corrinoid protein MtbC1
MRRMSKPIPHLQSRHPIRVVAGRTGLSPDVIRVWERRYGAVHPTRGEGGQRRYSDADVERLDLLRRATQAGRGISQVAGLSHRELVELVAQDDAAARERQAEPAAHDGAPEDEQIYAGFVSAAFSAVEQLDPTRLDLILRRAMLALGARAFIGGVLAPLLECIGDRWRTGEITPAHEHAATAVVQGLVHWLSTSNEPRPDAPTLVVATPQDERHELGAMLAATSARTAGWRVAYLGPDLPVEAIAAAAQTTGAHCVALSVVYPPAAARFLGDLSRLRERLGDGVPVVVGGAAAVHLTKEIEARGAHVAVDLQAFGTMLEAGA